MNINLFEKFDNTDLNVYITDKSILDLSLKKMPNSILFNTESNNLYIIGPADTETYTKITDLNFYARSYNANLEDTPNDCLPEKIYLNTSTNNLYFTFLSENRETIMRPLNILDDYTKTINIHKISIGEYASSGVSELFDIRYTKDSKNKNNLYIDKTTQDSGDFIINDFDSIKITSDGKDILRVDSISAELDTNLFRPKNNIGLENGSIFTPFLVGGQTSGHKSLSDFISDAIGKNIINDKEFLDSMLNAELYFKNPEEINKNNKLGIYCIPGGNDNFASLQYYGITDTGNAAVNVQSIKLINILMIMCMKIWFLEHPEETENLKKQLK